MPLSALRTMKEFSRRGNSACVAHPHSSFDANKTMFVFISHRWLSPSLVPTDAHPDLPGEGSPKLTLVVQACDHLTRSLPEGFETAVWMDWMSLNQDGNPAAELGDSMQGLIGNAWAWLSTLWAFVAAASGCIVDVMMCAAAIIAVSTDVCLCICARLLRCPPHPHP